MSTETAIERGRRFAAKWERCARIYKRLPNFDRTAEFCATRARWLRHAVLAMEERERLIGGDDE